jgi:hypothetical protein
MKKAGFLCVSVFIAFSAFAQAWNEVCVDRFCSILMPGSVAPMNPQPGLTLVTGKSSFCLFSVMVTPNLDSSKVTDEKSLKEYYWKWAVDFINGVAKEASISDTSTVTMGGLRSFAVDFSGKSVQDGKAQSWSLMILAVNKQVYMFIGQYDPVWASGAVPELGKFFGSIKLLAWLDHSMQFSSH